MLNCWQAVTDPKETFARVPINATHQQHIRDAISSYLANPSQLSLTQDLIEIVTRFDALPTYADMGAALLVKPNGIVLAVHSNQKWDARATSSIENDIKWKRVAYEKGAERFPNAATAFRHLVSELG